MAAERSKRFRVSVAPPPRTLDVQKFAESRASEIEVLHSIISNRLNNDFRSQRNKRRRTTGHDNRVGKRRSKKRRKLGQIDKGGASVPEKDPKKIPRRIRRRIELRKNPESGFCSSRDGTKRLRSHLWHAKRFSMTKIWGFHLPLGLQGRGRGSRAVLKWLNNGALVHDASYYCAVQLEGPEDSLLSILRMVLVPAPSVLIEEDMYLSLLSGVSYGKAMLHHAGAHPCQPIAPVTYMWRPWSGKKISVENKEPTGNGHDQSQITISESPFRQLWVWIHAAALDEGYDALKLACQKEIHGSGNFVNCVTREGELARLEVLGLKGIQILQKILSPTSGMPENSFQLDKFSTLEATDNSLLQKSFILEHDEYLPSRAILSLTVLDPRNLPEKRTEHVQVPSAGLQCDLVEDESKQTAAPMTSRLNDDKFLYPGWLKIKEKSVFFSDSNGLWDTCKGINPPLEESILCMEKHQQHLAFLYLDKSQPEILTNKVKEQSSRSCPIILLKDNSQGCSFAGWSIILPLSWVKAFWVPLVSHGAHAIGLREKHWISCAVGLPSFPFDFPDCNAYSCFMATEAASFDKKVELRPFPVRPLRVPIPPPWNCIKFTLEERSTTVGDTIKRRACKGELYLYSSLESSGYKNCRSTLLESGSSPFQGFVARTSNILTNYLSEIHGDDLLLFPGAPKNKRTFSRLMKNEVNHLPNPKVAIEIPLAQKLCFLRVLLYAYKEGVFEEGAVVCAPNPSDLSMWTDRSDRDGGLQIPQSLIGSYFKQQASSNWELEIPEDPVARESHRWPIGFVTTGFVRGSKKPVAQAFCEVTLLARLREEQWNEIPKKRKRLEIYVLVRNLRSSAYRLAVATIILEQQDEDVDLI